MSGYTGEIVTLLAVNAILGIGVYVTWASGQLSAAHPALAAVAGYASGVLSGRFEISVLLSAPIGIALAGLAGALIAWPTLRMRSLYLTIATLGFSEAFAVVATNSDFLGGAIGLSGIPLRTTPVLALVALTVVVAAVMALESSGLMLAMRAARDDQVAAEAAGTSTARLRIVSFALGSAIAGLSGVLYAHNLGVIGPVDFGFGRIVESIMFVLVGGANVALGPVAGAALFTLIPEYLRAIQEYRHIIFGVLTIGVVVALPSGLIPRRAGMWLRSQISRLLTAGVAPNRRFRHFT